MPATPANAGTARALAVLFLVALALAEVAAVEVDSPDEVVVAPEVDAEDCRQSKVSFWCSKLRRIEDSGSRNEVRKDTSDDLR